MSSSLTENETILLEALKKLLRVAKNYEVGHYKENIYEAYELAEKAISKTLTKP